MICGKWNYCTVCDGRERLWTVERFNLRQMKMETGQQVRMHVRNLLETAED